MKRFFKTMAFTLLGVVLSSNMMAAEKTLIIDGSQLTSTATTSATDKTYGDFTITFSDGAKQQASSGDNKFTGTSQAILIGKSGKYIYNKTPFGKKITKFELYANKGASAKVSVGVLFSTTAISAYATGTNTYTATLSTLDNVYDCSSNIPDGAKYFWYQVTNANNSQVMFRITYEEEEEDPTEPSLSVSPETIDFGTVYQNAEVDAKEVTVTFANLTTNDVAAAISGSVFGINKTGSFTSGDKITITPSTANLGEYEETLTVSATDVENQTVAVKMKVVPAPVLVTYNKVTDIDDLAEGDIIVLASSTTAYGVAPTDNHTYIDAKKFTDSPSASLTGNVLKAADAYELTLDKSGDNWTMTGADGLVGTTAAKTMTFGNTTTATNTWSISFDNDKNAVITSTTSTYGKIYYNTGSPRFLNYTSSQAAIQIYKKAVPAVYSEITLATCTYGSVKVTGADDLTSVASGTEITLGNTPAAGYTLDEYDVYKTGEPATKVTITDGKFKMPAYDVTVSATFKTARTLTGIDINTDNVKKTYWVGDTFTSEGLVVTAHFDGTDDAVVTEDAVITGYDMATAGDQTVTVSFTEGTTTKSATYTITVKAIANTQETAYTVAEAFALIDVNPTGLATTEVYVKGIVSSIPTAWSSQFNNITYNISDNGETTGQQFQLYRCSTNGAEVGNKVIAKGKMKNYQGTYEFDAGNTIVSIRKAAKLAWSAGAYTAELGLSEYDYPTLTKTPTSLTGVTYSSSKTDVATIDAAGVITLKAEGETTITASFAGDENYDAAEDATYILTVAAEVQRFKITYNSNGGSEIDPVENQTNLPNVFPTPTKDWKVFGGWYLDNETFLTPAEANAPLTDNTTLFAKWNDPLSIAEMIALIPNANDNKSDIYGYGYIKSVDKIDNGAAIYWITDGTNDFEVYKGKNINNENFTDASELPVGNKVMIFGNIKNYQGTHEFDANNYLLQNEAVTTPVTGVSLDQTEASIYVGQTTTLVANIIPTYATNKNVTWSSNKESVATVADGVVTGVAKGTAVITATTEDGGFTATCTISVVELPVWAYTYTSNVIWSVSDKFTVGDDDTEYFGKKDGTSSAGANVTFKVPAKSNALHFHIAGWGGDNNIEATVKQGSDELGKFSVVADEGITGSGYVIKNNPTTQEYFYLPLSNINQETTISITTTGGKKRIFVYGVNYVAPAEITLDEANEYDFGEVKENASANKIMIFTVNDFADVDNLAVSFTGEDADMFSAGDITATENDNEYQVEVTFTPGEIQESIDATLEITDGEAIASQALTGKGISATTPEIVVSDDEIDFGTVKQDATITPQIVTVTLNYLDAATASIDDDTYFSIDKTALDAGENIITISAKATSTGVKSAIITITGTGATSKTIAVTMDVISKYANEYTSNVKVGSDKVIIDEVEYEAVKAGSGSSVGSTPITVPEGAYALHFHAAGWNNEDVTLAVKKGDTELGSFNLYKDAGVSGSGPSYTLQGNNYDTDQYFYVEFDALEEETAFTFVATSGKRFVLYGVNQEGGLTKQLSAIEVSGTPNKLQYTEGAEFDPTGLTVMGTFTFGEETLPDKEDVTAQVTEWVVDPATLASTTTSVSVIAKVDEIASEEYIVENVRVLPENTDIINASTGTATTSTYKEFAATGLTNTQYAGKTALNNGNLTLSNASSHPGIVSTYTIGYIKSVKVKIVEGNTRNLDVYGSHRAYQSAEDLYSLKNAIRGTKIGTLTASGVLDLSEAETKYEFIGIRSEEGAIQVPEIQITWTPVNFLRISVAENIEGGTIDIDRTVATAEEAGNVQVTIEPTPNEGLQFDKLVIYNESDEDVTASITIAESGLAFTMPNYNVKVGATFKSQPVTAISLDKSAITVDKNNTETLTASFLPQGAFTDVTWTSANEAIAMVDEEGVVTGMGQGTTTITASCNDGALTATCTVTVNAQPEYVLVTDATSLQDGDVIVLGNAANNAVNGGYNTSKYLDKEVATITEGVLTSNDLMEITLCKTDAGWNLVTEQGHLGAKAVKNLLINDVYTDWTISISGNVATISAGEDQGRFLYNVNSPRFLNYSSATSTTMLLPEIYRLSNDTKKVVKLMDKNNVYAIYRVHEGENVTLSVALPSGCTKGWTMDGETYAKNATIENVTADMVLYAIQSEEIINEDKEISSKDVNKGSTITIGDGTTETNVTISSDGGQEKAQAYQIVVKKNATVTISTPSDISNLEVEVGGKVTVETAKKLTVNNFVIKSTMAGGESGQVLGVTEEYFEITGEAYYDLVLGDGGNPDKWHAFAVPFNVDAINGVYDENDNKLTNEVNYAIMDYHGDVRAEGKYGWKKFRGIMQPGVFYLMTVDGARTTYRMKMNGGFQVASKEIDVYEFAQTSGETTDAGWNGIANNQLGYSSLGVNVQVLNPTWYTYETMTASEYNFTVGTPFFYQANGEEEYGKITLAAANSENPAYAPRMTAEAKNIAVTLGNDKYTDRLYISATDEATNEYQIGHDLVKMTMTNTPTVPQIFAEAYGTKLSMIDVPMMYDEAVYALNLYAPANGEYTIGAAQVEGYEVFLTQYGSVIWNLSMSEATIELTKGNNTEYGLILKATSGHAPTDINTINGQESVQKFLYNSNIYIIRENQKYNAQGIKIQ